VHIFILSFATGTLFVLWIPLPLPIKLTAGAVVVVLAAVAYNRLPGHVSAVIMGFAVGVVYSAACASYWLEHRLESGEDALETTIEGEVISFPRHSYPVTRIEIALRHPLSTALPETAPDRLPLVYGTVRLNCYDCTYTFAPGQVWRIKARLRGIHGLANPGLFDYEQWAFQRRLVASGTVLKDPANAMLEEPSGIFLSPALRSAFDGFLAQSIASNEGYGIIRAITLGVRDDIQPEDWHVFRRTGTGHLVAISGLHVGLVFAFMFAVANIVVRLAPPLLKHIAAQRLAAIAALPPTLFYAWLAGFTLPTQRASIMLVVFYLAFLLGRRVMGWHTFLVALALVLVVDPMASLSSGFWLSFGAVAAIVWYAGHVRDNALKQEPEPSSLWQKILFKSRGVLLAWVGIQCAVSVVVVPLAGIFFGQLALASPLVNLIAIPYFSIAVVPAALLGVLTWLGGAGDISAWLLSLSANSVSIMQSALFWVSSIDMVSFDSSGVDVARLVLVILLIAGMTVRGRSTPAAAVALALLISLTKPPSRPEGWFRLTVLDVGQGLASVVKTSNQTLVFDTGTRFGPSFDMGEMVVNPFLERSGYGSVDVLVISHGDRDHAGGREAVERAHPSVFVFSSERGRRGPGFPCVDGVRWFADGVGFEFLSPEHVSERRHNNRSCVLRVWSRFGQALLPGDLEVEGERRLVREHRERLKSDVLVVPHHGSRTSSSQTFLAVVDPALAIIPRGLTNSFGHPHETVSARLEYSGIETFDTAYDGAVSVSFDAEGLHEEAFRRLSKPLWRSLPSGKSP
jgi:competence protein ComEC